MVSLELYNTIYDNDINIIRDLIDREADVNYRGHNNTPLILAAMYDRPDVCKLLLESGANVNLQNNTGNIALMFLVYPNTSILKLLLEYDVDINLANKHNLNALTLYKNNGYKEYVKILEEHIEKKKLLIVQKRLALGKLFYSSLGKNLVEEGLYEQISSFV